MSMLRAGALALLLSMPAANACASGGGHFRLGETHVEAKYAIAVVRDEATTRTARGPWST